MNEMLVEQLVKRKTPASKKALKVLIIAFTVLVFCASLLIPMAIMVGMVLAFLDYMLLKRFEVEYEFSYMKGYFDVDKIMGKEKRKKLHSFDTSSLEIIAPIKSHALDSYNDHNCKVLNYTSLEPNTKVFGMVMRKNNELLKILFEPNEELLNAMKLEVPRKINLY